MLTRLLVVGGALLTAVSGASAADIAYRAPSKAVVAPVPYVNWTGFYVGGAVGYVWGSSDDLVTLGGPTRSIESDGVVGAVFAGYDYQMPNNVVVGVRISAPVATNVDGVVEDPVFGGVTYTAEVKWSVLATGSIGYAMGSWLPYIGGGLAVAKGEGCVAGTLFPGCDSQTHTGYTLLAGLRYMVSPNWGVGIQYNYTSLDEETYTFPGAITRSQGFESDSVSALVTYRF